MKTLVTLTLKIGSRIAIDPKDGTLFVSVNAIGIQRLTHGAHQIVADIV